MSEYLLNGRIEMILKGSFDLHVHASPDPYTERRMDALETARHAYESEMSGFALKSHELSTAQLATTLRKIYPGLNVVGSITLNNPAGGLNPAAVEASAEIGAKVVWMPTFDSSSYRSLSSSPSSYRNLPDRMDGITLINESGQLKLEVLDILDVAAEHDMAVASGHVSPKETIALFEASRDKGISKLIATHPVGIASDSEISDISELGAYVELTFLSCMPSVGNANPNQLAEIAKDIGVDRCVVSTDFGQWMNPPAHEGMRMAIAALLGTGLTDEEVTKLVKDNPLKLV